MTLNLTLYPGERGGLWRTIRLAPLSCLNTRTTPADSCGRSKLGMAFRRSGVRLPPGPPIFEFRSASPAITFETFIRPYDSLLTVYFVEKLTRILERPSPLRAIAAD